MPRFISQRTGSFEIYVLSGEDDLGDGLLLESDTTETDFLLLERDTTGTDILLLERDNS